MALLFISLNSKLIKAQEIKTQKPKRVATRSAATLFGF